MKITNTEREAGPFASGLPALLRAQTMGESAIYEQEAQGQRELVASDQLPVERQGNPADWTACGFEFSGPIVNDPLFCVATLPARWTRRATEHDMWSHLVDELGRVRAEVFYKAAFYDRRAFMRLVSPADYIRKTVAAGDDLVLDDTWLTADVAIASLRGLEQQGRARAAKYEEYATDGGKDSDYWASAVAEYVAEADACQAILDRLTAGQEAQA